LKATNSPELIAEARRRAPSLTDEQFSSWLAYVEANSGQLVLTFDGSLFAEYPRQAATHADSQ
jgi:hypothetical protein